MDKHVGDATEPGVGQENQRKQWEEEEMSLLVLSPCDSGAASGSAFTATLLNVKVITGPWLLIALVERCRANGVSHRWDDCSSKKSSPLSPPLVLLATNSMKPPEMKQSSHAPCLTLPSSSIGKSSWASHNYMITDQDRFGFKAPLNAPFLGFPNIKTQFEPPIIISCIFKTVHADETKGPLGLEVSPASFKKPTRSSMVSMTFVAWNSVTAFPPAMFTLALPWPLMNHQLVEMYHQFGEDTVSYNQKGPDQWAGRSQSLPHLNDSW